MRNESCLKWLSVQCCERMLDSHASFDDIAGTNKDVEVVPHLLTLIMAGKEEMFAAACPTLNSRTDQSREAECRRSSPRLTLTRPVFTSQVYSTALHLSWHFKGRQRCLDTDYQYVSALPTRTPTSRLLPPCFHTILFNTMSDSVAGILPNAAVPIDE